MYVITLRYKVGLDVVDKHRPAHLEWLKQGYAEGFLLASGRQNPPIGGVILARSMDPQKLNDWLANDPFKTADLADYTITEFNPNLCAPEIDGIQ